MNNYSVAVVDETRLVWEGEYETYPEAYARYKDECRRSGYEVLLHKHIPESDSWEILHDRPQSYFEN